MLARRIFADGRTRAYAWGRSAAREDVAAAVEALLAMSGQFEQRRLARPAYQLARARRLRRQRRDGARAPGGPGGSSQPRGAPTTSSTRDAAAAEARLDELRALAEDTDGLEPGERGRPARRARAAPPPDRARRGRRRPRSRRSPRRSGEGAADLVGAAERALAPARARSRPSSPRPARRSATAELSLREVGLDLGRFLASLEAEPGRLEQVEGRLDRIADLRRRYRGGELRGAARRAPPAPGRSSTRSPTGTTRRARPPTALAARQAEVDRLHAALREARRRGRAGASPRRSRPSSPASGSATASFRVEVSEAAARARRRRRGALPRSGRIAGLPVRAGRRDRLRRRALPDRARDRGASPAARRWSSTRSTPASAARPPTPSARRSAASRPARRWSRSRTCPQIASLADRHFRVEKVAGDPTHTRIEALGADAAPRGARADARRRRVPRRPRRRRRWLAPRASCSQAARTSGGSSPSPTTSPTGGPGSSGVEPDRRGFEAGARWQVQTVCEPLPIVLARPAAADRQARGPDRRARRS